MNLAKVGSEVSVIMLQYHVSDKKYFPETLYREAQLISTSQKTVAAAKGRLGASMVSAATGLDAGSGGKRRSSP